MNTVLSTTHSTAFYIKDNQYLPCSLAIKFHNITYSNIPYRPSSCTPQFQHTRQTISAIYAQYSNYIAATHNITHSPCTSTCTPHPALHTPLPSTTLLCTQLTNTKPSWQNGTRCRDGVKLLWCHSHLVWLVFEGSIPTCACFHSENFLVTSVFVNVAISQQLNAAPYLRGVHEPFPLLREETIPAMLTGQRATLHVH